MSNYLGCVYVFSNPSMPGLLKVGKADNSEERKKELSSSTGVPEPFEEVAVFPSDHPYRDEREAHEILSEYRNKSNREFFKLAPEECIKILITVLGDPIPSTDKRFINIFEAVKSGNSSAVISLIKFANAENEDIFDGLCLYDSKERISFQEKSSHSNKARDYDAERRARLNMIKEKEKFQSQTSNGGKDSSIIDGVTPPKTVYDGEKKDGKPHGQGTITYPSGSVYVGELKDGLISGQGAYTWADGDKYKGDWKDGKQHGHGTFTNTSGEKYVGEYKDGLKHGQGIFTYSNGDKYEGEWKDGEIHGHGKTNYNAGITEDKFEEDWKNRAQFKKEDKSISYHAELKDGQYNGMGKVFENKVLLYEGELKDGIFEGNGKAFFKSGIIGYEGQWKDGKWHGIGKLYDRNGIVVYDGKWEDGKKID